MAKKSLHISEWDVRKVKSADRMFEGCSALDRIPVSTWDMEDVETASSMFKGCMSTSTLDLSSMSFSAATDANSMFKNCTNAEQINFSQMDFSNVTDMSEMLSGCRSIDTINLGNISLSSKTVTDILKDTDSAQLAIASSADDLAHLTEYASAPETCELVEYATLQLPHMYTYTSGVLGLSDDFAECLDATVQTNFAVDGIMLWRAGDPLPNPHRPDLSADYTVTSLANTFANRANVKALDLSRWDTSAVISLFGVFANCIALETLDVSNWDTSSVTIFDTFFAYCARVNASITISNSDLTSYEEAFAGTATADGAQVVVNCSAGCKDAATAIVSTRSEDSNVVLGENMAALRFEGTEEFTLTVDTDLGWNGTIEYSTDAENWSTWDGSATPSSTILYMRGTGNTYFSIGTASKGRTQFVFTTTGTISAHGRIDYLLDYATVDAGGEPVMADYCYYGLFEDCTSLVNAPELSATTLATYCYGSMFNGCTSLVNAPELPATTLVSRCYDCMFYGCTSLVAAPELPATTLASYCYSYMFGGCTSLVNASELPATTLAYCCYRYMFRRCTSLVDAPELLATTLADYCYYYMFSYCTSLVTAPELPATALADYCYYYMFSYCTSLKVSEEQTGSYPTAWRIPTSGEIELEATSWNISMLFNTGGTFTDDPSINTTYYLDTTGA